uniref:Uncharacterized protein n=1 Tax=Vitrella brassicaformis TaxID=1169539 RepID=A0A7S1JN14_9ALVE
MMLWAYIHVGKTWLSGCLYGWLAGCRSVDLSRNPYVPLPLSFPSFLPPALTKLLCCVRLCRSVCPHKMDRRTDTQKAAVTQADKTGKQASSQAAHIGCAGPPAARPHTLTHTRVLM